MMGLDVYLYKCPDRAKADEAEKLSEEFSSVVWDVPGEYETLTEEQKDSARQKCKEYDALVGVVGCRHVTREQIEIDSEKYPEHYFKIGYFRSSYNESGFNSVMRNIGMPDMYNLFGYENGDDPDETPPDWDASRERTVKAIEDYKAWRAGEYGNLRVMRLDVGYGSSASNEEEAMRQFKEINAQHKGETSYRAFSCGSGTYYLDGLKFRAFVNGKTYGDRPCLYAIYEADDDGYYKQSLEIILETIDYVLAHPEKEQFYLYWSG